MKEGPQQNQCYNYTSNVNKPSGFNKSKLIWLTLSVIIIITLIITLYFIFTNDNEQTQKTSQDTKLEECLKMEKFDSNCNTLFSSPDIEEKCEKLTNLKDECFYKIATIYVRLDLCWKIENDNLKQDCEMEVNNIPIDVPQDTDRFYPE
ncbi:MAG: hypothetical protein U9Q73_03245 [Nanoarchaeota archaeon]|nr:hypothetical protein [Nanoarchaeota archaeon]